MHLIMIIIMGILTAVTSTAMGNSLQEMEGITLGSTRVIYPEKAQKGVTFTVTNLTPKVYLLQSRVLPWIEDNGGNDRMLQDAAVEHKTNNDSPPFVVLAPLMRFEPEATITLQIRLTQRSLPKDRESVFRLALNAIPAQTSPDKAASDGKRSAQMVLALQNNLKLFYRPADIPELSIEERAKQLRFQATQTQLVVSNPTPYYITLGGLSIGATSIANTAPRMIAPFSSERYTLGKAQGTIVAWSIVADDGHQSEVLQRPLSLTSH